MRLKYLVIIFLTIGIAGELHSQTVWEALFSKEQSAQFKETYDDISLNKNTNIDLRQLKQYVKTLNNYSLSHISELNEEFQKKVINHIIATDSISYYEQEDNTNWWKSKFVKLAEIMPIYVIQKKVNEHSKPYDTIQIEVPGSNKTISAIINNNILKGFILSTQNNLIAEEDLRYLTNNEVYDLIAFYRYDEPLPDEEPEEPLMADNQQTETNTAKAEKKTANPNGNNQVRDNQSGKIDKPKHESEKTNYNNGEEKEKTKPLPSADLPKGLAYRIQIAAAHNPLTEEELKNRYKGQRKEKQFKEDGWIKYYVAETPSLNQAKTIVMEEGMPPDAFIMAYKNGSKAPQYLRIKSTIKHNDFNELAPKTFNKKVWVVQIAADKKPLTFASVKNRYAGEKPIFYINQKPWHRYSIGVFDNFKEANDLRLKCNVADAFVAAHKNSRRVDLWSSGKKNPTSGKPIHYIVQISANEKPLSKKELNEKYTGNQKVMHFQENGYHKYALGRFKTFSKALEVRNHCGVPDAFIKAYQDSENISLYKAKQITDKY